MRLFLLDITRKSLQLFFFTENIAFFFKKLYFQQFPRCYRNDLITSTVIVKTPFGSSKNVHWGWKHSISREKIGEIFFVAWTIAFFRKLVFSTTSHVLKNFSHRFHSKCQNNFWTFQKCSLRLLILDNFRKSLQLIFFTEDNANFFKKLCFQQFHKCYRNDLITSAVIVRIPFGPLQVFTWGLWHAIKQETISQNLLSPEDILFLKSLVLDFFKS